MIIDEEELRDGITPALIARLIERHMRGHERVARLKDYYEGRHDILVRSRKSTSAANNRVVCNHAKYIVDIIQSYLVGNPVIYSVGDGHDIEALKESYLVQDIASVDAELEKEMSITGRSYELVYADGDALPRSAVLQTGNTFVVYGGGVHEKPFFGVHYFRRFNIDGGCIGVCAMVADADRIYTYESDADSFYNMELKNSERHYFGKLPIIEYRNNAECQGDFEQLIPLINAYNLLESDRVNDKEQFVEAFLFLTGIDIDSEQAQKLREERILMGYDGATAQYLSKVMNEADIEVLRNSLREDIHRFAMVPDLSDECFGSNLSGVAIKYKLLGFEQHVRNKERYFTRGLRKRFELYRNFLSVKGSMEEVPLYKVKIGFTRNLPVNELEVSQVINNLRGLVSTETLISQLSFVDDPKSEVENSVAIN